MRFFFTVLTAIVLFACCPKQYYLIQPDGITMGMGAHDLKAKIDGHVVPYSLAGENRGDYLEMERSGLISYIGLGMLYSCDGIMQT